MTANRRRAAAWPPSEKMKFHRKLHVSKPRKEEHRRREGRVYLSRNRHRERKRGEKWKKNRCHLYLYRQAEPVQPLNRSEPAWTPLGPTARLSPFPGPIPLLFCSCTPWLLTAPPLLYYFYSIFFLHAFFFLAFFLSFLPWNLLV